MSKIISADKVGEVTAWSIPPIEQKPELTLEDYSEGLSTICQQLPTLQDIERLQKQAYDESYEAGYQQGLEEAKNEFHSIINGAKQLLDQISDPISNIDQQIKQQLVQLSLMIAKQVVKAEISYAPEKIIHIVDEALQALPQNSSSVYVRLHPADAAAYKKFVNDSDNQISFKIVEDDTVEQGGCSLYTDSCSIDQTVETQIAAIAAKFLDLRDESGKSEIEELNV